MAEVDAAVRALQAAGHLDTQFEQLLQLQDESDFLREVIVLYFQDSSVKLETMSRILSAPTPDFTELDQLVHQFKGSSASLGAKAMVQLCMVLRMLCQERNVLQCASVVAQMQQSFQELRVHLDALLQIEAQSRQQQQQH